MIHRDAIIEKITFDVKVSNKWYLDNVINVSLDDCLSIEELYAPKNDFKGSIRLNRMEYGISIHSNGNWGIDGLLEVNLSNPDDEFPRRSIDGSARFKNFKVHTNQGIRNARIRFDY